jgi:RNA polymerase sigma-70 factor (ECF subfamily)
VRHLVLPIPRTGRSHGCTSLFAYVQRRLLQPWRFRHASFRRVRDVGGAATGLRFRQVDDVAQLRPGLVALVRRVVPPWLRDHAEDIVHSAIAQVIERGNPERSPSYLMRAAHNAAIDEIRRRIRRPEIGIEHDGEAHAVQAKTPDPARSTVSREIDRAIRACLAALAAPRRAAVMLFLLGYSRSEAEAMSRWGKKRTEHLTYRGLADMRDCLGAKGIAP